MPHGPWLGWLTGANAEMDLNWSWEWVWMAVSQSVGWEGRGTERATYRVAEAERECTVAAHRVAHDRLLVLQHGEVGCDERRELLRTATAAGVSLRPHSESVCHLQAQANEKSESSTLVT